MKKEKYIITFYEYTLEEEQEAGKMLLYSNNIEEARSKAKKICLYLDWYYSIEKITTI